MRRYKGSFALILCLLYFNIQTEVILTPIPVIENIHKTVE